MDTHAVGLGKAAAAFGVIRLLHFAGLMEAGALQQVHLIAVFVHGTAAGGAAIVLHGNTAAAGGVVGINQFVAGDMAADGILRQDVVALRVYGETAVDAEVVILRIAAVTFGVVSLILFGAGGADAAACHIFGNSALRVTGTAAKGTGIAIHRIAAHAIIVSGADEFAGIVDVVAYGIGNLVAINIRRRGAVDTSVEGLCTAALAGDVVGRIQNAAGGMTAEGHTIFRVDPVAVLVHRASASIAQVIIFHKAAAAAGVVSVLLLAGGMLAVALKPIGNDTVGSKEGAAVDTGIAVHLVAAGTGSIVSFPADFAQGMLRVGIRFDKGDLIALRVHGRAAVFAAAVRHIDTAGAGLIIRLPPIVVGNMDTGARFPTDAVALNIGVAAAVYAGIVLYGNTALAGVVVGFHLVLAGGMNTGAAGSLHKVTGNVRERAAADADVAVFLEAALAGGIVGFPNFTGLVASGGFLPLDQVARLIHIVVAVDTQIVILRPAAAAGSIIGGEALIPCFMLTVALYIDHILTCGIGAVIAILTVGIVLGITAVTGSVAGRIEVAVRDMDADALGPFDHIARRIYMTIAGCADIVIFRETTLTGVIICRKQFVTGRMLTGALRPINANTIGICIIAAVKAVGILNGVTAAAGRIVGSVEVSVGNMDIDTGLPDNRLAGCVDFKAAVNAGKMIFRYTALAGVVIGGEYFRTGLVPVIALDINGLGTIFVYLPAAVNAEEVILLVATSARCIGCLKSFFAGFVFAGAVDPGNFVTLGIDSGTAISTVIKVLLTAAAAGGIVSLKHYRQVSHMLADTLGPVDLVAVDVRVVAAVFAGPMVHGDTAGAGVIIGFHPLAAGSVLAGTVYPDSHITLRVGGFTAVDAVRVLSLNTAEAGCVEPVVPFSIGDMLAGTFGIFRVITFKIRIGAAVQAGIIVLHETAVAGIVIGGVQDLRIGDMDTVTGLPAHKFTLGIDRRAAVGAGIAVLFKAAGTGVVVGGIYRRGVGHMNTNARFPHRIIPLGSHKDTAMDALIVVRGVAALAGVVIGREQFRAKLVLAVTLLIIRRIAFRIHMDTAMDTVEKVLCVTTLAGDIAGFPTLLAGGMFARAFGTVNSVTVDVHRQAAAIGAVITVYRITAAAGRIVGRKYFRGVGHMLHRLCIELNTVCVNGGFTINAVIIVLRIATGAGGIIRLVHMVTGGVTVFAGSRRGDGHNAHVQNIDEDQDPRDQGSEFRFLHLFHSLLFYSVKGCCVFRSRHLSATRNIYYMANRRYLQGLFPKEWKDAGASAGMYSRPTGVVHKSRACRKRNTPCYLV